MNSRIADALLLKNNAPIAIYTSDEKPEASLQFKQGARGCVMSLFVASARGRIAAIDAETTGCMGAKIGLGFCDQFVGTPGGIEYFLSTGYGEGYPEGEGYKQTPELAKAFVDQLPTTIIDKKYIVFSPLSEASQAPLMVSFLVNPDQLSALIVLANYGRETSDNVTVPFGAGCHSIFLLPLAECNKPQPKAIIGLIDITARQYIDPDKLSFTVPYKMFLEMEENVPGSFLEKHDWEKTRKRIADV